MKDDLSVNGRYTVTCYKPDGSVRWSDVVCNLIVNEGLDYILDSSLGTGSKFADLYIGITSGTPVVAATDTMASHAGWTEELAYNETERQGYVPAAATGQSVSNSASPAAFTTNANFTVGGLFLTSDNTKNGTTGTLISASAFNEGNYSVVSGDILSITYDVSATG